MRTDYYSDTDTEAAPKQANTTAPSDEGGQIAIIPRDALEGKDCKVGDRLTFEVTGVDEDSVQVQLSSAEHENETPEEERSEMDSMMSDEAEGEGY